MDFGTILDHDLEFQQWIWNQDHWKEHQILRKMTPESRKTSLRIKNYSQKVNKMFEPKMVPNSGSRCWNSELEHGMLNMTPDFESAISITTK